MIERNDDDAIAEINKDEFNNIEQSMEFLDKSEEIIDDQEDDHFDKMKELIS